MRLPPAIHPRQILTPTGDRPQGLQDAAEFPNMLITLDVDYTRTPYWGNPDSLMGRRQLVATEIFFGEANKTNSDHEEGLTKIHGC
ncbi:hypothetical protein LINPERHAP2_LOCUS4356 [Linum perenne]